MISIERRVMPLLLSIPLAEFGRSWSLDTPVKPQILLDTPFIQTDMVAHRILRSLTLRAVRIFVEATLEVDLADPAGQHRDVTLGTDSKLARLDDAQAETQRWVRPPRDGHGQALAV